MYLTIVMYHYVRPIRGSRHSEIKGLEASLFAEQIRYLEKWYQNVTASQVIEAMRGGRPLPRNAVLLTFDDGYSDHFQTAFPILQNHGMHGCFFPPARCIEERRVLDVNKIHYILASCPDKRALVDAIEDAVDRYRHEYNLDTLERYRQGHALQDRFDSTEVVYIKRMLQRALPEQLRGRIANELFSRFVGVSEECLANELYMTRDQLLCMARAGMTIGSHGHDHYWLNQLDESGQEREVDLSLRFLDDLGVAPDDWVMCYPYGAWDEKLLSLLKSRRCGLGLTTEVDLAGLDSANPLLLPRLDTNDLPKDRSAAPAVWTQRVLAP